MKQVLFFILALLFSLVSYSHDIAVKNDDGVTIYYNWSFNKNELFVSYRGSNSNSYSNEYTGKVVIPKSVTYNGKDYPVTIIDECAFCDCSELTSIEIPNSVMIIRSQAFWNCSKLTSMIIDDGDYNLTFSSTNNYRFIYNCPITTLHIGRNVLYEEGYSPFVNLQKTLQNLTIGNKVTKIGYYAFYGCTGLSTIEIPDNVTSIGYYAFKNCSSLKTVISKISNPFKIHSTVFDGLPEDAELIVPDGTKNKYLATEGWNVFSKTLEFYNLNLTVVGNGDVVYKNNIIRDNTSSFTLVEGSNSIIAFNPDEGYKIKSVKLNGTDITSKTTNNQYTISNISADVTLEVVFELESYVITYLVDGQTYKTASVKYGSVITPESNPTKEGYTFSGWSVIPTTMPAHDVTITGTFSVNYYTLTYMVDGRLYKIIGISYGTTITPETEPTKEGYTFSGWNDLPETMPAYNVTITGSFTVNSYTLTYIVDGQEYKSYSITYGTSITPENKPKKEGHTFSGWYGLPKTMPAEDVIVTGTFIVNSYTLTYKVDGQVYKTSAITYGTTISPENEPTKEGYTFSGWSEIPETMPAYNLTVTGTFSINSYTLTYIVDGQEYKSYMITYGNTIVPESKPTKEGYTFSGWTEIPKTMPATDIVVTGQFIINQYILTYIIDGKEYKSDLIDYNSVLVPKSVPIKKGMTFSGWNIIPNNMPARDVTVTGSYSWSKKTLSSVIYQVTDTLNDYVSVIGNEVINGDASILPSVEIDGYTYTVNNIGNRAFYNCKGLISVSIPESITKIGNDAFYGCTGLTSVSLPDNTNSIVSFSFKAFNYNVKLKVNKGTKTLLYIWNANKNSYQGYAVYDKQSGKELLAPELNTDNITQTKATVRFDNVDLQDGFTYTYNGEPLKQTEINYSAIKPDTKQNLSLIVSKDDVNYIVTGSYTTKGMNTKVDDTYEVTASSIRATGSYTEEDAKVVAQRMYILNKPTDGNECFASGLNPGRSYTVVNEVDVDYGGETTATYRASRNIYPARLIFKTAQPKVVNTGNAIVSATVNLDPEEENIGFEWRRTDWTDEFPSNTGQAYLYDGIIEGYIKNLNTDKLWKFRPYYLSDDGTYHYGDWMGLDPTNTSYFEPTVHTYSKINIEGNTALVRGYALAGTANIKVQGFMYWKTSQGSNASHQAPSIPSNAKTITAIGQQIITATLAALDYNSVYHYVAFVTTEDGTTYYGEEQVFTTPTAPAGVDDVIADAPANMKKGVYNLTGVKLADELSELQGLPQGVYIIDGKKIMVK